MGRIIPTGRLVEVGGGCAGCGGDGNARGRSRKEQPPPTSTNLHQPPQPPSCRSHLNTIQRIPIVAASTTESTMLSWRRPPPGTGIAVASGVPYVRPAVLTRDRKSVV